jgi:thiaminase/transcriptional activator TenA
MLTETILRQAAQPVWDAIMVHPFVIGLGDGSLDPARFRYFVGQDYVYLQDFSRVLAMGAVRSPSRARESMFLRHAATVHEVEQALHREVAPSLGLEAEALAATPPGPVTAAYTDHLMRAAWSEASVVLAAAVLPCYWIYREVGRRLADSVPDQPQYKAWIETYAGEAYGTAVAEMLEAAGEMLQDAPHAERARARRAFWRSSRYEWLFWQQAWLMGRLPALAGLPEEPPLA